MNFEAFPFDMQFCEIGFYLADYGIRHAKLMWADDDPVLFTQFELGDLFPLRKYILPNCTMKGHKIESCAKIGILWTDQILHQLNRWFY